MHALEMRLLTDESGAIAIERGLLAALVLLGALSVLSLMGVPLDTMFAVVVDRAGGTVSAPYTFTGPYRSTGKASAR